MCQSSSVGSIGNSPLSQLGVGEILPEGNSRQQAMGEAGAALSSSEDINLLNPAQLYYNRQVNLEAILRVGTKKGTSSNGVVESGRVSPQLFVLTLPIARPLSVALGIRPYSAMDYRVVQTGTTEGTSSDTYTNYYTGSGTLSQVFMGAGLRLAEGLTVGAQGNLWLGTLQRYSDVSVGLNAITKEHSSRIADVQARLGTAYKFGIGKHKVSLAVVTDLPTSLRTSDVVIQRRYNNAGTQTAEDTLSAETTGRLQAPQTLRMGLSFEKPRSYVFALDIMHDSWAKVKPFGTTEQLANTWRAALGTEWIPDYNGTRYGSFIRYRAGFYARQLPYSLDGKRMKDLGITLGMGWPILRKDARYTRPMVNTNISAGLRSVPGGGTYKEYYLNFTLGLILNDSQWFVRYKID
jgi:hypothetical protein